MNVTLKCEYDEHMDENEETLKTCEVEKIKHETENSKKYLL